MFELISLVIHIIFFIWKTAFLATFLSALSIGLALLLSEFFKSPKLEEIKSNKSKFWLQGAYLFSVLVFLFSFSYWGNRGGALSRRIPLGYNKEIVHNTNEDSEPFEGCPKNMGDFIKADQFVCGYKSTYVGDQFTTKSNTFLVWNLEDNTVRTFKNGKLYREFALRNNLPQEEEFQSFQSNYHSYWSGLISFFTI